MIELVTGGAASGKSEYAESLLKDETSKVYLATMRNDGSESADFRISRHRKLRDGKDFRTVECPMHLERLMSLAKDDSVLLEDLPNLLTNEMYFAKRSQEDIFNSIAELDAKVGRLVIVSSQIFSDGRRYDEFTEAFIRNLACLNRKIAECRDCKSVTEVVCGIPCIITFNARII